MADQSNDGSDEFSDGLDNEMADLDTSSWIREHNLKKENQPTSQANVLNEEEESLSEGASASLNDGKMGVIDLTAESSPESCSHKRKANGECHCNCLLQSYDVHPNAVFLSRNLLHLYNQHCRVVQQSRLQHQLLARWPRTIVNSVTTTILSTGESTWILLVANAMVSVNTVLRLLR